MPSFPGNFSACGKGQKTLFLKIQFSKRLDFGRSILKMHKMREGGGGGGSKY